MSTIRVSAEEVAALGRAVAEVAASVGSMPDEVRASSWAGGPGATAGALQDLVGNWEHERHVLARGLDELARAALAAGAGYAALEVEATRLLGGGPC
jgi:hypothetical protein